MREGEGSRTAERVAVHRAVHQLIDRPLVFDDPVALAVVRRDLARSLRDDPRALGRSALSRLLRAFLAVRSRFAEDCLGEAVARGVRQYAIIGAGFDTFASRNPYPELRVFEVDHPATQARKRARLAAAGLVPPVTFVPADLAVVPLDEALATAGFDRTAPSFFSWLGVVPYLELSAIRATLRFVASLPADATIVFDYGIPPSSLGWLTRFAYRRMASRVANAGEPWKTFFEPAELLAELTRAGFAFAENVGPEELNRRYFAGRADGLRVGKAGHIAIARNQRMGLAL